MLLECWWNISDLCLVHSPSGLFGVALCWNNKGYWCWKEVPVRSFLVMGKMSVIITVFVWCRPVTLKFLYVIHQCRDIWLQIEGNKQVPSIPVTAHELWLVCVPIYRSVSVYFNTEFNFTGSFLDLYLYIIRIKETKIMNNNKEMYIALKFTVAFHIVVLLFAVLQWYWWKGGYCPKCWRILNCCALWILNCGPSTRSAKCLYWRCVTADTAHGLLR